MSRRLATVLEEERLLAVQQDSVAGLTPRRLQQSLMQGSDVIWTMEDMQEIYTGPSSVRTKMEELRSKNFLDWQLYQLEVLWMSYNGDSGMFALNTVSWVS